MIYFSIRKRLLLGIFLSMIVILGGMGLAAHFVTEHESEEIFSARLATSARVLEVLAAKQLEHATINNPIIIELPDELEHQHSSTEEISGHPYESKISFQIWHSNGKLLAKSATAPDKPLGPMTEGFGKNQIGDDLWQVFKLKSGDVWVMVAEMDTVRDEMAGDLGVAIMTPLIIGSLILLIVINLIAYRSLQPLQSLANVIAARDPQSIKPIKLSKTPLELKPVIDELNHLLDRVQKAFKREQQFIDAAAHEIRTPMNGIIGMTDLLLDSTGPVGEQREYLQTVRSSAEALLTIINDILDFSRIEAGRLHLETLGRAKLGEIALWYAVEPVQLRQRNAEPVHLDLIILRTVRRHDGKVLKTRFALMHQCTGSEAIAPASLACYMMLRSEVQEMARLLSTVRGILPASNSEFEDELNLLAAAQLTLASWDLLQAPDNLGVRQLSARLLGKPGLKSGQSVDALVKMLVLKEAMS